MPNISDIVATVVGFCVRRAFLVVMAVLALAVLAGLYALGHFAMSTDTEALLSPTLPFRQLEARFDAAFPAAEPGIVIVIDGATPEIADFAAQRLKQALAPQTNLFDDVYEPDGGQFFRQNGLLFESLADVRRATSQMIAAQPLLGPLAADPSLRGVMATLSTALAGVSAKQTRLEDLDRAMRAFDHAVADVNNGQRVFFSWQELLSNQPARPEDLRREVLAVPKRNYSSLEPASDQAAAIRSAARALNLDEAHGARVRLTGSAMLADEEFASLAQNAVWIALLMGSAIIGMLWMAVKSVRMILAIVASTLAGLTFAAAFGLLIFGRFNIISVAFIPLFVGLGVDFGIQFGVRFRANQRTAPDVRSALVDAGRTIGPSLALAALAISLGFAAFVPTKYLGLSQLGAIAGSGLVVAFALTISFLPALTALLRPGGSLPESQSAPLRSIDAFVLSHRRVVLAIGALAAAVCLGLLPLLRFDFNPLHLRNANTESVSTFLDLARDPDETPYFMNVLTPSLSAAKAKAAQLERLPEVARTVTLADFVPDDQPRKLALISDASFLLDPTVNPFQVQSPPSDAAVVAAIVKASRDLRVAAGNARTAAAADARLLARDLDRLSHAARSVRMHAREVLISPLDAELNLVRSALSAQTVTIAGLPAQIKNDWLARDGRVRVAAYPRGDANDNLILERFAKAVRKAAPDATGAPISVLESSHAIERAFAFAGALSFVAITALLLLALRRVIDVVITMIPILLTGLLTLGCTVVLGEALNFANIIALPLLFGVGVAFHIYFVMAWRAGHGHLLQSSLARGVFFSALTTATGFGSLWLSSHPGTASMGELLMISLIWTLASALLFQPALMGPAPIASASQTAAPRVDAA